MLIEHSLRLIAKAEVDPPRAAKRARQMLAQWRAASPEHEAAAMEAIRRWQALSGITAGLKDRFEDAIDTTQPASRQRRHLLTLALVGGGASLLGSGVAWHSWRQRQPLFAQTYQTRTAEVLAFDLPDQINAEQTGSRMDLGAQTRVHVRLYRHRRSAMLDSGDARFEVAPDASRPFTVQTRLGTLTVVGTAFTVSDRGGPLSVSVEHGHVRWQTANPADPSDLGPPIDLFAGNRLTLRPGRPPEIARQVDASQARAWREGWLLFDNVRLDEALPAINAFRTRPIVLADARVGALPLTGRFKAADSNGLLQALPAILPLQVRHLPDGSVQLK
jgi:transmembrane sensor